MKKTLLYVVVLLILGGAVWYRFFGHGKDNPFGVKEAGFTIKDTAQIGRIFIADFQNQSILIEHTDTGWMVNKTYHALNSTVRMVLNTLYQQQALYPVSQNAIKNAIQVMTTTSTKVEVYDRANKVMSKFYVGSVAPGSTGTEMLMEGASVPYVVHIQGFVGVLNNRYTARLHDWRDRTIFNIPASELKSVSLNYFSKPENSFKFEKVGDKFTVTGKLPSGVTLADLNMHNAGVYAGYFGNVSCEGYLNGTIGMDSIIRTSTRHSNIDVEGIHGQKAHVEIFWMAINKRSKNQVMAENGISDDYDTDRLYALINGNKDTVMIQQFVFKNLFRKIGEFYQKTPPQAAK